MGLILRVSLTCHTPTMAGLTRRTTTFRSALAFRPGAVASAHVAFPVVELANHVGLPVRTRLDEFAIAVLDKADTPVLVHVVESARALMLEDELPRILLWGFFSHVLRHFDGLSRFVGLLGHVLCLYGFSRHGGTYYLLSFDESIWISLTTLARAALWMLL